VTDRYGWKDFQKRKVLRQEWKNAMRNVNNWFRIRNDNQEELGDDDAPD